MECRRGSWNAYIGLPVSVSGVRSYAYTTNAMGEWIAEDALRMTDTKFLGLLFLLKSDLYGASELEVRLPEPRRLDLVFSVYGLPEALERMQGTCGDWLVIPPDKRAGMLQAALELGNLPRVIAQKDEGAG